MKKTVYDDVDLSILIINIVRFIYDESVIFSKILKLNLTLVSLYQSLPIKPRLSSILTIFSIFIYIYYGFLIRVYVHILLAKRNSPF